MSISSFEISKFLALAMLSIGMGLAFTGTIFYWTGYHNHDLGLNLNIISLEHGLNLGDEGYNIITGERAIKSSRDMIIEGNHTQQKGIAFMLAGVLLIGVSMSDIAYLGYRRPE